MFVGEHDDLADPTDTANVRGKLSNVRHYKVYPKMDHMSFGLGKDMSFMKDVIAYIRTLPGKAPEVTPAPVAASE